MSTPLNGSVMKAFAVLRLITPERPEITAQTVVTELGANTATAHRFLLTLEEIGAVVSYRRGSFRLGPTIEELGRTAAATNQIAERIRPFIVDLAQELHESVMVCRLGRDGPTCIAVAPCDRPISVSISVGTVLPMTTSAQGKLWLAEMPEAERQAWTAPTPDLSPVTHQAFARNIGESEPDIGAVAVPIRDRDDTMVLTLSTFGMLSRFNETMTEAALPALRRCAERIGAAISASR